MNNENSRRMRLRPVAYFIATQLAMTGIITTTAHARDYFKEGANKHPPQRN